LTGHDDVIKPLPRGVPRLNLALGTAPARAGPGCAPWFTKNERWCRWSEEGSSRALQ